MKLLCLVVLVGCTLVQGGQLNQNLKTETTSRNIQRIHLKLQHESESTDMTDDDRLLSEELLALEQAHGRNVVGDAIHARLEELRDVIVNGNDNMAPLDPLVVDEAGPIEVTASGVAITAMVRDFSMTGIRWFVLDRLTFNPITLAFSTHVTIPWLVIDARYDANAMVGFIQHTAGGIVRIFVHRIEMGMDMRLGFRVLSGQLFLRELNIDIDIHDTQVSISGLTGSTILNGLINAILQSTTQDLIQTEMQNVSSTLSVALFDTINDILSEFTINDILGLV